MTLFRLEFNWRCWLIGFAWIPADGVAIAIGPVTFIHDF